MTEFMAKERLICLWQVISALNVEVQAYSSPKTTDLEILTKMLAEQIPYLQYFHEGFSIKFQVKKAT